MIDLRELQRLIIRALVRNVARGVERVAARLERIEARLEPVLRHDLDIDDPSFQRFAG